MGSPCEIQLDRLPRRDGAAEAGVVAEEAADEAVLAAAVAEVERLEARYSRYRETSFLAEINRVAAVGGELAVDPETAGLLDYAATCHAESGGLFDVTSGILRRAWRFKEDRLPSPGEVDALLEHVGFGKLEWRNPILSFSVAGLELDFGGIVKEYAADRVAALLQQAGRSHALVNLGGDIRVAGPRVDGRPWQIGILWDKDPRLALPLIERLRALPDVTVGDNVPYSGQLKGDTLYQHGTMRGLAHALVEVRQDLILGEEGQAEWAARLAEAIRDILEAAPECPRLHAIEHHGSHTDQPCCQGSG